MGDVIIWGVITGAYVFAGVVEGDWFSLVGLVMAFAFGFTVRDHEGREGVTGWDFSRRC